MRKKILAFVFAAGLLSALAQPVFSGGGAADAVGRTPRPAPVDDAGETHDGEAPARANEVLKALEAEVPPPPALPPAGPSVP